MIAVAIIKLLWTPKIQVRILKEAELCIAAMYLAI